MPKVVLKVASASEEWYYEWGVSLCSEIKCATKHLEKQPKYVPPSHFSVNFLKIKESVWEKFCFKSYKKMNQYGYLDMKNYD